jgi:cobalt-precorrin 5A hydrolase/precorrin-3B C17-methyltransferase
VGLVRDASRPGERVLLTTLGKVDPADVDMLTTVVIGSSQTRIVAGRMVTPRGYRWAEMEQIEAERAETDGQGAS